MKFWDFVPGQSKLNDPELRRDFKNFCQRMRLKWHIRDEPTSNSSETINHRTKLS